MKEYPNRKFIENGVEKKPCFRCKCIKETSEFYKSSFAVDGLDSYCKTCKLTECKERYINGGHIKHKITQDKRRSTPEHKIYARQLYLKNRHISVPRAKERSKERREEIREYARNRHKIPQVKIANNLRKRVRHAIKNGKGKKTQSTEMLIGCSFEYLKTYLESKFLKGMTWENYTIDGWHVDHIIPCSSFDLTIEENQFKCFHYTNMQPLWATDNLSKNAKLNYVASN